MRAQCLFMAVSVLLAAGTATPARALGLLPDISRAGSVDVFQTGGDAVHYSSTPPPTISAHGWWLDRDSGSTKARVTVELQIRSGGSWRTVATGSKTVKQGGGSARRANARRTCAGTRATRWRSRVDVDVVGVADSSSRLETPPTVPCDGSGAGASSRHLPCGPEPPAVCRRGGRSRPTGWTGHR